MQFTKIICLILLTVIGAQADEPDYTYWCGIGCVKRALTLRPRAVLNMRRAAEAGALPEGITIPELAV
jgi:hypothetical protein